MQRITHRNLCRFSLLILFACFAASCGSRSVNKVPNQGETFDDAAASIDSAVMQEPVTKTCASNKDCKKNQYCHSESGCLASAGSKGHCRPKPTRCFDPNLSVCGCDGLTYPSSCNANRWGTNVAFVGDCDPLCNDITCSVEEDCCTCRGVEENAPRGEECTQVCEHSLCGRSGFHNPVAYCARGKCFITDSQLMCQSDKDCQLVDDCCVCLALHIDIHHPACTLNCDASTCFQNGFSKAKARCLGGMCRLTE